MPTIAITVEVVSTEHLEVEIEELKMCAQLHNLAFKKLSKKYPNLQRIEVTDFHIYEEKEA